jgi:hypothetical protein
MRYFDYLRSATVALTIACVSLLGCNQPSTATSPPAAVNEAAVNAAVAPYIGTQVPGLSVAVGYHGRVIFAKAYERPIWQAELP